ALFIRDIADFEQAIDKKAESRLCRHTPGAGMGRENKAQRLEIRHDITDRGSGKAKGKLPRENARANRLAGFEIGLDHAAQDLARTLIEIHNADHCRIYLR